MAMWTYAQVKAADKALSPAVADPAAAAAALNAQTVTSAILPVPVAAVHGVLLLSGEWLAVERLSQQTPSSAFLTPSATATDQAIAAAQLAIQLSASKVETVSPESWNGFFAQLSALHSAGVIGAASLATIQALATPTLPAWMPALTDQDITAARSLA